MNRVVVGASEVLACCFPDEKTEYADGILNALRGFSILAPAVWPLEIANAILVGERAKRIGATEIREFLSLIQSLEILRDDRSYLDQMSDSISVARQCGLTSYDAAYIGLASREGVPLATSDKGMRDAAKRMGLALFDPPAA